jgi:pimeloyl-ACP methyl ester carboxylesterase
MSRATVLLLVVFWVSSAWATSDGVYDYPFDDAFVATVVGTPSPFRAELPDKIPLKRDSLTIFEDREVPEIFWYTDEFHYSYAVQDGAAPLVFIIAGTGGSHAGDSTQMLARAFYQAGFHIVALSSPTLENFVVSASTTSIPGHAFGDAEDLYRVMERIWDRLKTKIEVSDFYVTGYSLGGFNAAFVSWLDEQKQLFNFRKALLINPPWRLYSSLSLLDRMIENIPGGIDNFPRFFQKLVRGLTEVYKKADRVDLGEDALYAAYEALDLKDEELAALIGVVFRIASSNMVFTSDVMTNYGYIKPKHLRLTKNSSLTRYNQVGVRLGFTDYFHDYFYPYYKAQDPSVTRKKLIELMSLASIEDYLRENHKIELMHNENDLILAPGEIDNFRRVFGERAKIFPKGGHLGNMEYRDNIAHMISVFKQ